MGLDLYDYGARNYDPALGRWMNVDPLAERHPEISPFVYCANNPVVFVDPDGQDWRINYVDNNGKAQTYIYNGGASALPDNQFVRDFVSAYEYNVGNGGGDSMKAIAENSEIIVDIQQSEGESTQESGEGYNVVNWNPNGGVETTNGTILSPATVLEHESVHGLRSALDPKGAKREAEKPDSQYDTKAERIAITGSEQKTALANKEIRIPEVTRNNHKGQTVITTSPTSTNINRKKTYNYLNNLLQHGTISTGFGGDDVKKYKQ